MRPEQDIETIASLSSDAVYDRKKATDTIESENKNNWRHNINTVVPKKTFSATEKIKMFEKYLITLQRLYTSEFYFCIKEGWNIA